MDSMGLADIFLCLKHRADLHPYPTLTERRGLLTSLHRALLAHQQPFVAALTEDFGHRPGHETLLTDLVPTLRLIHYCIRHLGCWMKGRRRRVGWIFWPASAKVVPQPLGVVGVISPWNFPISMAIPPVACALAAGNRVMLKVSEFTPATNRQLRQLLADAGLGDWVVLIEGDGEVASQFAALPFDHLLFTGSTAVGRKVMTAAAANLTPVTLELGGKSPVVVAPDADLQAAAERILFGKGINNGQACVAPDYLLVPRGQLEEMATRLATVFNQRYPDAVNNPDLASIINDRHWQRLVNLMADAESKGAKVQPCQPLAAGGRWPRRMPLQLLLQVNDQMVVMEEEIFGPLLPLVPYDEIDDALAFIRLRPRPLAFYLFTQDQALIARCERETHAGALVINDTLFHVAVDDLPFGGIGASGMGSYHGPEGFLTFSKVKPVVRQRRPAATRWVQAPYRRWFHKLLFWLVLR